MESVPNNWLSQLSRAFPTLLWPHSLREGASVRVLGGQKVPTGAKTKEKSWKGGINPCRNLSNAGNPMP